MIYLDNLIRTRINFVIAHLQFRQRRRHCRQDMHNLNKIDLKINYKLNYNNMVFTNRSLETDNDKMMQLSNKDKSHVHRALFESKRSNMLMKHGCVVALGRKVIAYGHNHSRTKYGDRFTETSCSCHAEMDALRKIVKYKTKGKSSKFRRRVVQRSLKVVESAKV